jgi:hypothetical protein
MTLKIVAPQAPVLHKRLESLYERRAAIDTLIRALEDYERCRAKRLRARRCATTWVARYSFKTA